MSLGPITQVPAECVCGRLMYWQKRGLFRPRWRLECLCGRCRRWEWGPARARATPGARQVAHIDQFGGCSPPMIEASILACRGNVPACPPPRKGEREMIAPHKPQKDRAEVPSEDKHMTQKGFPRDQSSEGWMSDVGCPSKHEHRLCPTKQTDSPPPKGDCENSLQSLGELA